MSRQYPPGSSYGCRNTDGYINLPGISDEMQAIVKIMTG